MHAHRVSVAFEVAAAILAVPRHPATSGWRAQTFSSALAQLVEQLTVNQRVAGSSPAGGATLHRTSQLFGVSSQGVCEATEMLNDRLNVLRVWFTSPPFVRLTR